jgi:hypothetical protein
VIGCLEAAQNHRRRCELTRKVSDCRDWPGPCTLTIAGEEAETVEAVAQHLVAVHDKTDDPALRDYVRGMLKEEATVSA